MSSNYYLDNEDMRFQLERAFDWTEIISLFERDYSFAEGHRTEAEAREFYKDILENVGKYVATEVAPRARTIDRTGSSLEGGEVVLSREMEDVFNGFKEMGLYALNLPRELGGLNAPFALYFAIAELIGRADIAVLGHYGFHGGIAMSLFAYAVEEGAVELADGEIKKIRFQEAIREISEGEAFGCMVLTESDAGSDLGALRARAVLGADGKWRLSGQKIFITSGHGQYQLVLAKTEDSGDGLKDLSLFLVPRKVRRDGELANNVEIERLEEKLGIHGSVTCTLSYDNSEAELIGRRGQGFQLMLLLMNNARLGVGFEALGLAESAYRQACAYAAERRSMGKTIDQHEMIADYLDRMDVEICGLRALAYTAAQLVDLYGRLELKLKLEPPVEESERKRLAKRVRALKRRARDLTPLIKYFAAEKAVEISRVSLQIHGGVGYTKDYEVEKLLRDALVLPIYEGTSQIQALMAMKDQLQGAIKNLAGFVRSAAQVRIAALSARDPLERKLARLQAQLHSAVEHILARIAKDKWSWISGKKISEWSTAFLRDWDARRDFAPGLLHAERLTRILCEVRISEILVKQSRRFPERRELAERYLERAAPIVSWMHDEIAHTGERLLRGLAAVENPPAVKSA